MRSARRGGKAALERRPAVEPLEDRLAPATLTVNTLADETSHSGTDTTLSLREAINVVNSGTTAGLDAAEIALVSGTLGTNDTIQFDSNLAGGTIFLTQGSSLTLSKNVTIQGPTGGIKVDGNAGGFSVFAVTGTPTTVAVTLNGLTVQHGSATAGAGIFNQATLTVHASSVTGNTASQYGGGIFNEGVLTVDDSTISANSATVFGAGIANDSGANLTVQNSSVITGNTAASSGGGIENRGTAPLLSGSTAQAAALIQNSTVSDNQALGSTGTAGGGGVDNLGVLAVTDSTFSNNRATALDGGGIHNGNGAVLSVGSSTFTTDYAFRFGGGIFNDGLGLATVSGSTFSSNYAAQLGGGIDNLGGVVEVRTSTFDSNFGGSGGGINNTGTLAVNGSTFFNNTSGTDGAGLSNDSTTSHLFLTASTLVGNAAGRNGGGLNVIAGAVTLINVTATGNRANTAGAGGLGGAVFVAAVVPPLTAPTVVLDDTLVADNFNGAAPSTATRDDIQGALDAGSTHDLISDGTGMTGISNGGGNQIGTGANPVNPLLAALSNYGGPTATQGLLPGSPAINAGTPVALATLAATANPGATTLHVSDGRPFVPGMVLLLGTEAVTVAPLGVDLSNPSDPVLHLVNPLTATHPSGSNVLLGTDQRGISVPQPAGGQVDIGAFESRGFTLTLISGDGQGRIINTAFALPLAVSVGSVGNEPVVGGLVTFTVNPSPGGAAATLSASVVTIVPPGTASVDATANGVVGSYTVTASIPGSPATPVVFHLTNNPPITLSPSTLPGWTVNQPGYSQTITANGGTGAKTISQTAGNLPPGLTLSAGAITGTPTQAGTFNFTVTATDTGNQTGTHNYSITINPPVSVTAATLANGKAFQPGYSQTITATGGTGAKTFILTGGALPDGLTLDPSGAITGMPTVPGTFNFTVTATDTTGASGSGNFSILVTPGIGVTPATLSGWTVNRPGYSQTFGATGATGAITVALTGGALPPGLTLNTSTATLSGTPTTTGTFNFTITATDSLGATGSRDYAFVVNPPPTLSAGSLPAWTVNQAGYNSGNSLALLVVGGTAPMTFSLTSGALPAGLTLTPTGAITGKPTSAGTFNFSVKVTDTTGAASAAQSYSITINPAVTITTTALAGWTVNRPGYTQTLAATGGTGAKTFSLAPGSSLPPGLALSAGGAITGMPTLAGTFNFTVTATDTTGAAASHAFTVVINPALALPATTLPDGLTKAPYNLVLPTTGGTAPFTFAVTGGALPAGLTLSPAGVLTGTPTQAVTNQAFAVTATDAAGATASQGYTLTVHEAGSPGHQLVASFVGLTSATALVGTGSVTLSGQLSLPGVVPTGTVLISVGGSQVSAALQGDGSFTANLPTASLPAGVHTITYQYGGDALFAGATGTGTLELSYGVHASGRAGKGAHGKKVVTLKVQLTDASGKNVSAKGTALTVLGISPTSIPGLVVPPVPAARANRNGRFKFTRRSAHGGVYEFSLKTKGLLPGTFVLLFTAGGDASLHSVTFVVK